MSSEDLNRVRARIRLNRLLVERHFDEARVMAAQDEAAFDVLVEMLGVARGALCFSAAVALIGAGQKAVAPFIGALQDEQFIVRQAAAYALGDVPDRRAVAPLMACLGDAHAAVRLSAAAALGKIGDSAAVEPLIAALSDEDSKVRRMAASALGKLGAESALAELERVVREDPEAAENAAKAIASIRSPAAGED
jgi:HEAT repeat protein